MELDEIITPCLDVPPLESVNSFIPIKHEVKERPRITAPRRSRSRSPINIRRSGDWDCKACKGMNYASRLYCFKCKAPKDDTLPKFEESKASRDWICGNCNENNFGTRKICFKCSAPPSAFNPSNAKTDQDWECMDCSGNNFSRRVDCYRCHAPKPSPRPSKPSYDSKYVGDWICPECSGNNYSKRVDCYRCSAPKPEDEWGRRSNPNRPQFDRQPRSQFNGDRPPVFQNKYVDDWICPNTQCGGNNFSKRVDCYKCKTVKPGPRIRMNQTEYNVVDSYKEPLSRDMRYRVGNGPPRSVRQSYQEPVRQSYQEPVRQAYYEQPAPLRAMNYGRDIPHKVVRPEMKPEGAQRPGDWECPGCGANNFSRRLDCFKCQKIKPGGASNSKFKDDWICCNCQGNNYSRRTDCYKCKQPKP